MSEIRLKAISYALIIVLIVSIASDASYAFVPQIKTSVPIGLSNAGRVIERYDAKGNSPLIYVIQSLHCHPGVQKNISKIIENLKEKHGDSLRVVGIEGSSGKIDTSSFENIPHKKIQKKLVEYFTEKGELQGAEIYALLNPKKVELYGIEDEEVYWKNFGQLHRSVMQKDHRKEMLLDIDKTIKRGKEVLYTKSLKEFEDMVTKYEDGRIGFEEYVRRLVNHAFFVSSPRRRGSSSFSAERYSQNKKDGNENVEKTVSAGAGLQPAPHVLKQIGLSRIEKNLKKTYGAGQSPAPAKNGEKAKSTRFLDFQSAIRGSRLRGVLPLRGNDTSWQNQYPEIEKQLCLYDTSKKINQKQVMWEAQQVVKQIAGYLSKKEKNTLKTTQGTEEYYTYFSKLLKQKNVMYKTYRNIDLYLSYVEQKKQINQSRLFVEIDELRYEIAKSLARGKHPRMLVYCDEYRGLLEKYTGNSVSIYEREKWEKGKKEFYKTMNKMTNKLRVRVRHAVPNSNMKNSTLQSIEQNMQKFYKTADKRNEIMIRQMLRHLQTGDKSVGAQGTVPSSLLSPHPRALVSGCYGVDL